MNVCNKSEKVQGFTVKSVQTGDFSTKINNSGGVLKEYKDFKGVKIERKPRKSEETLLREVTPGENYASFLEKQLSLSCSKADFQPITLFKGTNFKNSRPNDVFGKFLV